MILGLFSNRLDAREKMFYKLGIKRFITSMSKKLVEVIISYTFMNLIVDINGSNFYISIEYSVCTLHKHQFIRTCTVSIQNITTLAIIWMNK